MNIFNDASSENTHCKETEVSSMAIYVQSCSNIFLFKFEEANFDYLYVEKKVKMVKKKKIKRISMSDINFLKYINIKQIVFVGLSGGKRLHKYLAPR